MRLTQVHRICVDRHRYFYIPRIWALKAYRSVTVFGLVLDVNQPLFIQIFFVYSLFRRHN
jgi:hypothetical protein